MTQTEKFQLPIHPNSKLISLYQAATLDQALSFKHHTSNLCKPGQLELRRVSATRHYVSVGAAKALKCSLTLLWVDYCNSAI